MSRVENDYTDALQKIFREISYSKYKVIGSANLKAIRYISDYDVNEIVRMNKIKSFIKRLKWIFTNAKSDPDFYITDFKAGEINREPIRWTIKDIMREEKDGVSLENALQMKATIKLDTIILVDNKVTEITNNFFLGNEDKSTLKDDLKQQIKDGMFFKALKRIFSIREIEKKPTKKLVNYFNSDVGLANKCKSDLLTIISLIEQNFKPVSLEVIRHNIQLVKYELSGVSAFNISSVFDGMMSITDKKELVISLQKVADAILEEVNLDAEKNFAKLIR